VKQHSSGTCTVDWHSPSHQHPLMFVMRVFIKGQQVDTGPVNKYSPAGGQFISKGRGFNFIFVLTNVMLTCNRSSGSSCGSLSYEDLLVHGDEPKVSEWSQKSKEITHDMMLLCILPCNCIMRLNGCASEWTPAHELRHLNGSIFWTNLIATNSAKITFFNTHTAGINSSDYKCPSCIKIGLFLIKPAILFLTSLYFFF